MLFTVDVGYSYCQFCVCWGGGSEDPKSPLSSLDHSCNKNCDLIGQGEVSISHRNS